ncbi:MAG: hypothetical protein H0X24_00265 [Ktedonobacterales bacterium]|nr:hypothetical protein [Ktedonobacterales bacterium]
MSAIDEDLTKMQRVATEMKAAALKLKDGSPMRAKLLQWAYDIHLSAEIVRNLAAAQTKDHEHERAGWLKIIARDARNE